ncbi:hypothetical protein DPMN_000481 [Dreissena polymorpha]|uniref:Glycoside hydrolase family 31 N-terminal domain-containing protein n=1 Tax=Dreissena polymorpha TaxID=45954 RepID=A0A9D4MIB7_DREPO|nr:hypothetical protein DPMN_000481 [Dreissena polymorpha]
MRVAATTDEKVYGLGEQYSYLNLRGRSYPIWVREQGETGLFITVVMRQTERMFVNINCFHGKGVTKSLNIVYETFT